MAMLLVIGVPSVMFMAIGYNFGRYDKKKDSRQYSRLSSKRLF